jgi:NADPH-dependent glutamate synthase beta subunit-like oxidoreductase
MVPEPSARGSSRRVLMVGAGPAGMTAAAELSERGVSVDVLEQDPEYVGSIVCTVD